VFLAPRIGREITNGYQIVNSDRGVRADEF